MESSGLYETYNLMESVLTVFSFQKSDALGSVISVDTATVTVRVENKTILKRFQVNRPVVLESSSPTVYLIGVVTRITRVANVPEMEDLKDDSNEPPLPESDLVRVTLIGSMFARDGSKRNVFKRTLDTVPDIDSCCYSLNKENLTAFMQAISTGSSDTPKLNLGNYTIDEQAVAHLNGNKFFQRHALIVGSTGSGKSWTTARILEQIQQLPQANAIVFDVHGEYGPLNAKGFQHLKIAGPSDIEAKTSLKSGVLHLPYWLLGHEGISSLLVDRKETTAPNQIAQVSKAVREAKEKYLGSIDEVDYVKYLTTDSPIPYRLAEVKESLEILNKETVEGARGGQVKGPYNGQFTRLLGRFDVKIEDRRLGFLFDPPDETMALGWLSSLVKQLLSGTNNQGNGTGGIKIVDFSEVPSAVLPLMVSLLANVIFTACQWMAIEKRHPVCLFCDEAHLYLPDRANTDSSDSLSVKIFERIAKEGRKFGVGLVVISQRPSEVNRTILSQCSNVVAMRLTNGDDQNVIKRLLPDNLGGFGELLPILDTGEALVVGDAILLPTRVRVAQPNCQPNSKTVNFWDEWAKQEAADEIDQAVRAWRIQSQSP